MERIIKFRAWDEGNNVMHSNVQFITSGDGENDWIAFTSAEVPCRSDGGAGLIFDNPFFRQQIKLMQFTGLKDKNGTEIYEGDIVRRNKINYAYDEIDNPKVAKWLEEISFIEYRHNGFWVNSESFGYEGEDLWDWDSLEVIGNIYEHKQLLENGL